MPKERFIVGVSGLRTTVERSRLMSKVRGRGNKSTELRLAELLRAGGVSGWRRHYGIEGTPDFAFRDRRIAVFVDGCFWHGCPRCHSTPKRNATYWDAKVIGNRARDRRVTRTLRSMGWTVIRLWECILLRTPSAAIRRISRALLKGSGACDPLRPASRRPLDSSRPRLIARRRRKSRPDETARA